MKRKSIIKQLEKNLRRKRKGGGGGVEVWQKKN